MGLKQLRGLIAEDVGVLHASWWDCFIHAGCKSKRHITPQGAGVATGPAKSVVGALRGLGCWTWKTGGRLDRLFAAFAAHTCASVVGISMEPSVVGRGWSPVSPNKPPEVRGRAGAGAASASCSSCSDAMVGSV
jgi:hypothetical protein